MIGCDKNLFEKREVMDRYSQLCGGGRKQLSTCKLMQIMQKYKLWNVTVRGRHGEEHYPRQDHFDHSSATVVKREVFSRKMSRGMLEQAEPVDQGLWGSLPQ